MKIHKEITFKVQYPHTKQGYLWVRIENGIISVREPGAKTWWVGDTIGRLHVRAAENHGRLKS